MFYCFLVLSANTFTVRFQYAEVHDMTMLKYKTYI